MQVLILVTKKGEEKNFNKGEYYIDLNINI